MTLTCKSIGCSHPVLPNGDFCGPCLEWGMNSDPQSLQKTYPALYRTVGDVTEIDTYAIHRLFQVQDYSGCLQKASTHILLSGTSKCIYHDIREARDTLTRWLQLNQELIPNAAL